MVKGSKILFWFREDIFLHEIELYESAIRNNLDIIPVFCFDPREGFFFHNNETGKSLPVNVSAFCEKFHNHGGNVVIFHDYFEKVIPSLARVLSVRKVITQDLIAPEKSEIPSLTEFRNQKALEVGTILNLHSIPLEFQSVNLPPTIWHDIYTHNKHVQG